MCCSKSDVYVTSGGRVLRRSEELRSCGVSKESTMEVTSRMRGGGKHKDKTNQVEKKRSARREERRRRLSQSGMKTVRRVRLDDGLCALVCDNGT